MDIQVDTVGGGVGILSIYVIPEQKPFSQSGVQPKKEPSILTREESQAIRFVDGQHKIH